MLESNSVNEHRTPERVSIRPSVIADRVAGMTYIAISTKYGIPEPTVARWCRHASRDGLVTAKQIGLGVRFTRRDVERYNQEWIDRTKANCIIDSNGCWLWKGFVHPNGYGGTSYKGKPTKVHRAMYMAVHGVTLTKKKPQQSICHTCDVRRCCNPDHLWVGSQSQNIRDSVIKGRHQEISKTHCERGHEFTPENTAYRKGREGRPTRSCKMCQRGRQRVRWGWPPELAYSLPAQPLGYIANPLKRNAA